jgi:hypothetical protein
VRRLRRVCRSLADLVVTIGVYLGLIPMDDK